MLTRNSQVKAINTNTCFLYQPVLTTKPTRLYQIFRGSRNIPTCLTLKTHETFLHLFSLYELIHCTLFDYFQSVITQGGLLSTGLLRILIFIHMLFFQTLKISHYKSSHLQINVRHGGNMLLSGEIAFSHM